jgi:hypothetical protein
MKNKLFKNQIVKTVGSDDLWEVIFASDMPYLKLDDGSYHYVISLRRVDDWQDTLIVNDTQIEEIEVSDTMDKKKLEINCPPLGTDSYWRIAEYRINELAKAINRKTEYMLEHGGKGYDLIKLWAEEIIQQCAMIEYLDIDGREEG